MLLRPSFLNLNQPNSSAALLAAGRRRSLFASWESGCGSLASSEYSSEHAHELSLDQSTRCYQKMDHFYCRPGLKCVVWARKVSYQSGGIYSMVALEIMA